LLLLSPLAVVFERRGQGLGAQLVQEALRLAKVQGHMAVILVGDPAYYSRFGFKSASDFGISNTNGIPDANVMVCELVPGSLKDLNGSIKFQV
jgi:predicted N-acetyltransferase YhbS